MIQHRGRALTAILTLFLFPISQSFGAIKYVNGANAVNGGGTSWADAYNNLQSAIAGAGTFDQIWIAQGTYYPSVPAGRSATFSNTTGYTIYGGFNGTETAVTQANPALYPTILSGDIGTPGNSSDNCYHVVTFNANLWIGSFNGVTIQDGSADGAFPDNTGGGILFLAANSGEAAGSGLNNIIFANNYAVYGAAIGAYGGNGELQINYGATNCVFHDNAATYGGAIYNTIINGEFLYVFENDIFYNNIASSGNASVFGNSVTNSTTTQYFQMENCLFYDEAIPILTNNYTNSGTTAPSTNYDIIWTSGTPYTTGISGGNNPIVIGSSDINGTLPNSSDFDADPLFVNAAGYDFHVSPCSPVIDKGPSFPETTTDIGGSPRKQGPLVDVGPYETLKGTAATAPTFPTQPTTYCQNATASAVSATGSNLLWYTAATGGTGSSTPPTPITTTNGSTTYYVSQTPSTYCESPRASIIITVDLQASQPTFPTQTTTYCENATASAVQATGSNLEWYTAATGGTGTSTAPTPNTATPGPTTWYVSQTPTSYCESPRAPITVTIDPTASQPTFPTQTTTYCENATATAITATGSNLEWYTAATGGTGSTTAPTPNTTTNGSTTWYVSQTPTSYCESPRSSITITVASQAGAPSIPTQPTTYCEYATASAVLATGSNLLWYTAATGGTGNATAPTPNTTSTGPTTWYVSQTPVNYCESPRSSVTVTINPAASQPTFPTQPTTYCENATAAAVIATGTNMQWYTVATGGTGSSTAPTPNTATPGPTTWYVSQTPGGSCESPRASITVTVASQASTPTIPTQPTTYCQNATATAVIATGSNLEWYTTATGGSGTTTAPTPNTTANGPTTWYVSQTPANSCESPRVALTITVNAIPQVTIDPLSGSLCVGNDIKLQANGADTYQWSPATGLSDAAIGDPTVKLQSDIIYTVTGTSAGCSATAQVDLTVSANCLGMGYYIPNAFSPNGDGQNDIFRVKTGDLPKSFTMMVFNRYGGKIFESTDINSGWNGSIGGSVAPAGTYVYSVFVTTSQGETIKRQGTVIVVR